jgi:hypothetical protein
VALTGLTVEAAGGSGLNFDPGGCCCNFTDLRSLLVLGCWPTVTWRTHSA